MSLQVSGRSRGGARPPPPLFFDQTLARRAEKNFLDRPIPLISGSGWPGPPLSAGLDARMQVHYNDQVTFLSPLLPRSPRLSVVSTSPLTSFPHRFNSSNWFCFSTQFQLNTSYSVLSNKDSRISGVQSWCLGNVPEHGTLGTLTWSHSFFHIPTLRIRTGCQCPRLTWPWPSSRELMVTGSTSFLSLRDKVLFCILCYTPFPMTSDRAKLSKYVRNDIRYPRSEQCHFGPVAQHSLVLGYQVWTSPYSLNLIINRI